MSDESSKMSLTIHKKTVIGYSNTETFLSEQIESIINESVLDEDLKQPMSHINIENTVKAITEFLVICHRNNSVGTCKATMCRQLQLALQGRGLPLDADDIGNYEAYYRLQYTLYDKLYQSNVIYALFCMPTLNNLALHYLENGECPEKARKCLNNVQQFYSEYMGGAQKLPAKMVKDAGSDWVKKRTKDCLNIVEYFYTASLVICSRYYFIKENYRMAMKVGLRHLRRLTTTHAKKFKETEWIETATSLAVTCIHTRALPQSVYLINAVVTLIDKMEEDVKKEEHNNCGHMTRINNTKRRFIKQLRTEVDLSVIRIAVWILEEAYKRNNPEKYKLQETYEKVETFPNIPDIKTSTNLPINLSLDHKEFGGLLKKARNLLKLHKKVFIKSSDWNELQTRVHKIAQMRI